jgi:hypothetical protein
LLKLLPDWQAVEMAEVIFAFGGLNTKSLPLDAREEQRIFSDITSLMEEGPVQLTGRVSLLKKGGN